MLAYALTINKQPSLLSPTRSELLSVFHELAKTHSFHLSSRPVQCFEHCKSVYKTEIDLKWIHYHACVHGRYIDYKKVIMPNYSIKFQLLKDSYDIINWCGYVMKDKIDGILIKTIKMLKKPTFKKDHKAQRKIIRTRIDIRTFLK